MSTRSALAVGVLICLAAAFPAAAGEGVEVEFAGNGVVRGHLGPAGGDPLVTARDALAQVADALGVDPSVFEAETVRESIVGTHVRGREFRGGVPVEDSSFAVHIVDGQVRQVEAHAVALPGGPVAAPLGAADAVARAERVLGVVDGWDPVVHRVLATDGEVLRDVWRVTLFGLTPAVSGTVLVSSADGSIVQVRDDRQWLEGSTMGFDPDPIVRMRNDQIRQPGLDVFGVDTDLDSAELTRARTRLPLRQLSSDDLALGVLRGPWVDVQGPLPLPSNGRLNYTRSDPRFEVGMAYAHLDRVQRYFQSLGFRGLAGANAEQQEVIALPLMGFQNAFYQPGQDVIVLGNGGVDFGEDAEVIVHEYGHAVQDDQVRGWGREHEGGAMGEGFSDFLGAAYYARSISRGFNDLCLADWVSTSFMSSGCLRRMDSAKRYPEHVEGQVHADGEMWAAFLWRIRALLDDPRTRARSTEMSDRSIRLVVASHEFMMPNARFGDGVAALRLAAEALGHPEWRVIINREAKRTGFPLNP